MSLPSALPPSTLLPFDELSEGVLDQRRVIGVRSDRVLSRQRGRELVVDRILVPDFVNVVALTENAGRESLVLVRQWRFGQRGLSVALPGGLVDEGESHRAAGLRELLEETGYAAIHAEDVVELGYSHPNPALMGNVCAHLLVPRAQRVADPCLDPNEELEVLHLDLASLDDTLLRHEITDALALAALLRFRLHCT
ncbi:MAG: NUDIX hydrolase [Myxococcota bacterium]